MSAVEAPPLSPEAFDQLLTSALLDFGLELEAGIVHALSTYLTELDRWRRRINLTGNLSGEALARHALESLLANQLIAQGERVVDIGSGGGFPGLPIAISRPDASVTLVEPRRKKATFLRHVARTLGLRKASVLEARIQDVGGWAFDVATTRAVGRIEAWIGSAGFLRPGGLLLVWTTRTSLSGVSLEPFRKEGTIPIQGSVEREIVVFRRI